MKRIPMFLVATIIVTVALVPWGFWRWLWESVK